MVHKVSRTLTLTLETKDIELLYEVLDHTDGIAMGEIQEDFAESLTKILCGALK